MPDVTTRVQHWLEQWASATYAYLTTIGRRTGRTHRIEIWFAVHDARIYLMSGGRDRSDWVRNLRADPRVTIELGGEAHAGAARILQAGTDEDQRARELLVAKYATPANALDDWKRRSLPVVIEFPSDAEGGENMATWTTEELSTFGDPDEVTISTVRKDGTLRKPVIVWIVRHGDDLYIRSVNGRDASWFRGVKSRHEGRIRAGSAEKDVAFVEVDDLRDEVDAAYWEKYRRYPGIVPSIVKLEAQAATLRLDPR